MTIDPTREATHRTLMRLYLDTGRRAAALRQYHACERVLSRDLGVKPDATTRALYDEAVGARAAATGDGNGRPRPAAILIVEGETVTRAVLERCLGSAGYDVTTVSNGAGALVQLSARHFDLMLTDIATPTVDGLALPTRSRERGCIRR